MSKLGKMLGEAADTYTYKYSKDEYRSDYRFRMVCDALMKGHIPKLTSYTRQEFDQALKSRSAPSAKHEFEAALKHCSDQHMIKKDSWHVQETGNSLMCTWFDDQDEAGGKKALTVIKE